MATLLTTANIIVSGALKDAGYQSFGLLDFLPVGGPVALVGILYIATMGRRLMPKAGIHKGGIPQQVRLLLGIPLTLLSIGLFLAGLAWWGKLI